MKVPLIFNYVCPACLPFRSLLLPEARLFPSLSHIATGLQGYISPDLTVSLVFFFFFCEAVCACKILPFIYRGCLKYVICIATSTERGKVGCF